MTRKNLIFVLLIGFLVVLAVSWVAQKRQIERYQLQQFVDFQETLIQLSRTFNNLAKISEKDSDHELFNIIVNYELADLESIMGQIRKIEVRIDSQKTNFSEEYSIQKLLTVIKEIEDITRDKGAANLTQMFLNIAEKAGDVAYGDTNELTPQTVEELIVFIEEELEKADN
ncbi:hypothetical protein ABDB91_14950 [Desulfoscipio sp. XC116]|uniref:hypothetical protein n=1 Tax=Desulfoscipio sp. XC116 TaxID=3144975 RepID=UPI00325B9F15